MMVNYLLCVWTLALLSLSWPAVSGETYYVIPTANTSCPEEGVPCFTLSEYATKPNNYFALNSTFILLHGNHSLDSDLQITNISSLTFLDEGILQNTRVFCDASAMLTLKHIDYLEIRGIIFCGCTNNTIIAVKSFILKDVNLLGLGHNGSGLKMNEVNDAKIINCLFLSLIGSEVLDPFHPWNVVLGGGGIHVVNSNVSISDTVFENNVAFVGGALLCENSTCAINNCSFTNNIASRDGGGIYTAYSIVSINNTMFLNNKAIEITAYGGAIELLLNSTSTIENCAFINNSAGYGGAIDTYETHHNQIRDTVFIHNTANIGSALYIESADFASNGILNISNNTANSSVVYILDGIVNLIGDITMCNNYGTVFVFASQLIFNGQINIMNNSKAANGTEMIHQEGGSLTCFQSEIVFTGTSKLMYNTAIHGGAISAMESKLFLYGNITIAYNNASLSGGGIYAYQSELNFNGNCSILGNMASEDGGGIRSIGSTTRFIDGNLDFTANTAEKAGGAMCLELNSRLYVVKASSECMLGGKCTKRDPQAWQRLEFRHNSASYGGALYIADRTNSGTCDAIPFRAQSTSGECFFQALALHPSVEMDLNLINTYFNNNTALIAGSSVFGGLLDRCTVSPFAEFFQLDREGYVDQRPETLDAVSYFLNVTNIQREAVQNEVSSKAVRVCFCNENKPDCGHHPPTKIVRKGETFNVSLVAVDQVNNTLPNSSIHNALSSQTEEGDGRSLKRTYEGCTELSYSITSRLDSEELFLHASGPCKDNSISRTSVSVEFKPCPVGFRELNLKECQCDPILYPEFVSNCSIDKESVRRKDAVWISVTNSTENRAYIIYSNCPFDYCLEPTNNLLVNLNIPDGADVQCAFNRSGKLCGSCKDGLSLSLGGSRCKPCSNSWLALLIVFAIAGVALVAFILVCNMTVAVGTINGLIFYANIIAANRAIFIRLDRANILTIFIAWLNLDFGFETCFYDGLDGYAKTWLQFVFPIYILILVIMVMYSARCSPRFAKLLSNRNPVATLATLILLSYAKLVRTILAALSFATLQYHSADGEVRSETVWLVDPNIRYFEGKHIPLFITAILFLLVGLSYTFFLFFWQWLQRCPNKRCLRWIRDVKLNAFMDATLAPYSQQHRYWTGLLLIIRFIIYLEAGGRATISTNPGNTLLGIIIFVSSLFLLREIMKERIYRRWPLNALESSFFFNLVIFAAATLYIRENQGGNQNALAYTSTSIAFITFLAILVYHACTSFKPLQRATERLIKKCKLGKVKAQDKQKLYPAITGFDQSGDFSELREPVLDSLDDNSDDYRIVTQSTYKPPQPVKPVVTHTVVEAIPSM